MNVECAALDSASKDCCAPRAAQLPPPQEDVIASLSRLCGARKTAQDALETRGPESNKEEVEAWPIPPRPVLAPRPLCDIALVVRETMMQCIKVHKDGHQREERVQELMWKEEKSQMEMLIQVMEQKVQGAIAECKAVRDEMATCTRAMTSTKAAIEKQLLETQQACVLSRQVAAASELAQHQCVTLQEQLARAHSQLESLRQKEREQSAELEKQKVLVAQKEAEALTWSAKADDHKEAMRQLKEHKEELEKLRETWCSLIAGGGKSVPDWEQEEVLADSADSSTKRARLNGDE